jgi:nucleoside-diphosphate-sugar epimerase
MLSVAVTGADSPLGRKVRALVEAVDPDTAPDPADPADRPGEPAVPVLPVDPVEVRAIDADDVLTGDLKREIEDADVVVHLLTGVPPMPTGGTRDVEAARRVLDAAGAVGVSHVVLLSDATVYGAWANNPVPLTEDAVLRPNAGFIYAAERAEIERLAVEWRSAHPGTTVSVLRPVRTPGHNNWLVTALRPAPAVPELAVDPPAQYLDLDDLASAVDVARRQRLDGAFNVAPDQAIPGDEVRSLTGAGPKVRLPERTANRLVAWRFRSGLGATPPELVPYTLHPWLVANDALRAAGWTPLVTSEEACVEAHEAGPWATMSPRRRQEIALGVAGVGVAGLVTGVGLGLRRWLRR